MNADYFESVKSGGAPFLGLWRGRRGDVLLNKRLFCLSIND